MYRRASLVAGCLALVVAAVLMVLPLHHMGLSGNALSPSYGEYRVGWYAYASAPVTNHVTANELRAFGVQLPQDVVTQRRELAGAIAAAGALLLLTGLFRRRRQS